MFSTPSQPRRPRPPGLRRPSGPLRATVSEASALPTKASLARSGPNATPTVKTPTRTPSVRRKGKGKAPPQASRPVPAASTPSTGGDKTANPPTPTESDAPRGRPLSMMSDSSLVSPPPPYHRAPGFSDLCGEKESTMSMIPPPPEQLESGPTSVRTSLIESEHDGEEDDDEVTGTLTLKGLRRLLQERESEEAAMAAGISARLEPFEKAQSLVPSPGPTLASPLDVRPSPFQHHVMPSSRGSPLSRSQQGWRPLTASQQYERHLAFLHAEEEEERVAALEAALADARDSAEAQRKANARLRRDNCKLRQQLEHAEDAVAEHLENEAFRSSPSSSARNSPYNSLRRGQRPTYSPDDRMGWGAISFPEFPRDLDPDWRINLKPIDVQSDVASEHTAKPPAPDSPGDIDMVEALLPMQTEVDSKTTPVATDGATDGGAKTPPAEPQTSTTGTQVIIPAIVRTRPTVSSQTFISPGGSADADKEVELVRSSSSTSFSTRSRQSPYPSPTHARSGSTSSSGAGPHRRMRSIGSTKAMIGPITVEVRNPVSASPDTTAAAAAAHMSPATALSARMDSVRSSFSKLLGKRSLGSELGSNYSPSPLAASSPAKAVCTCSLGQDCSCAAEGHVTAHYQSDVPDLATVSAKLKRPSLLRSPIAQPHKASPAATATFVLRGNLSRSLCTSAYEALHEGSVKHIRWASEGNRASKWSPTSWPTPSPSPRLIPLPLSSPDEVSQQVELFQDSMRASDGSFAALRPTDSPGPSANLLAPQSDPWDEYSDRATPSPRSRALRPLLLCSKPAVHARSNSLATLHRRSASFASGNGVHHPAVMTHRRNASLATSVGSASNYPRASAGPVTIPGRVIHDLFCFFLIALDLVEWAIILVYRLVVDIRAGPDAAM